MKALRFIGISLLVTFFVIVLSSCGGDSDEPNVDPTPIPAAARIDFPAEQNTNPVISSEGGAVNITFTSSQAWTASIVNDRADEWISLSTTNGMAGTSVLSITTKTNDTYDERSATITIKSGTVSKNIIVTQKQKDALLVSSEKIEMDVEGGEVQVEVKANVDFSVETDVDWISHISTRSLKTSNLVFTVTENEDTQKREGHITVKSGMLLETVTVYQAASTPTIIISQNEYTIGSDGGDIKVEVSSNVDVSVTLPKNGWISESSTRSMSTNTYVFTVSKNEGYDSRSAEILFTNKENNLSEKVVITQMQRDGDDTGDVFSSIKGKKMIKMEYDIDDYKYDSYDEHFNLLFQYDNSNQLISIQYFGGWLINGFVKTVNTISWNITDEDGLETYTGTMANGRIVNVNKNWNYKYDENKRLTYITGEGGLTFTWQGDNIVMADYNYYDHWHKTYEYSYTNYEANMLAFMNYINPCLELNSVINGRLYRFAGCFLGGFGPMSQNLPSSIKMTSYNNNGAVGYRYYSYEMDKDNYPTKVIITEVFQEEEYEKITISIDWE